MRFSFRISRPIYLIYSRTLLPNSHVLQLKHPARVLRHKIASCLRSRKQPGIIIPGEDCRGLRQKAPRLNKARSLFILPIRVSQYKMPENQDDSYAKLEQENTDLPDQEIRGRAASAAPAHEVQEFNTGMFVRIHPPDLLGWERLAVFAKRFRTWECYNRCDKALETALVVKNGEITRSVLEGMHGKQLLRQSYMAREALNRAAQKEYEFLAQPTEEDTFLALRSMWLSFVSSALVCVFVFYCSLFRLFCAPSWRGCCSLAIFIFRFLLSAFPAFFLPSCSWFGFVWFRLSCVTMAGFVGDHSM